MNTPVTEAPPHTRLQQPDTAIAVLAQAVAPERVDAPLLFDLAEAGEDVERFLQTFQDNEAGMRQAILDIEKWDKVEALIREVFHPDNQETLHEWLSGSDEQVKAASAVVLSLDERIQHEVKKTDDPDLEIKLLTTGIRLLTLAKPHPDLEEQIHQNRSRRVRGTAIAHPELNDTQTTQIEETIAQARKQQEASEQQVAALTAQVEELTTQLDEIKQLNEDYASVIRADVERLGTAKAENARVEERLNQQAEQLATVQQQLADAQAENQSMRTQVEQSATQLQDSNAQIESLEQQIAELQAKVAAQESRKNGIQSVNIEAFVRATQMNRVEIETILTQIRETFAGENYITYATLQTQTNLASLKAILQQRKRPEFGSKEYSLFIQAVGKQLKGSEIEPRFVAVLTKPDNLRNASLQEFYIELVQVILEPER